MKASDYKCIIFDLDGTLVTTRSGDKFRRTANDWEWISNRLDTCQRLRDSGIILGIATNQAGVAFPWSRFTEQEIQREIDIVARSIVAAPADIKVSYTTPNERATPHYWRPNDNRRKPGAGMLLEIISNNPDISLDKFLMVGDREEDEKAAIAAGIHFMNADDFFNEKEKVTV